MEDGRWAPGVHEKHTFDSIDKPTFDWVLQHYDRAVPLTDDDKAHLEALRYRTIPDAVKARGDDPHVEKEEMVMLVTWKLSHGTFRPALKTMVQQNDANDVLETTRKGFKEFKAGKPKDSIKILIQLRGIGPATASLLLSVYDPQKAPFFSDEFFRWAFFEDGEGKGWDRRIKYTAKEYDELYERVQKLVSRLGVSAVEAEKVAYVLGKDGPSGASAREDLSKSSKRKAEEMDHAIAAHAANDGIKASVGTIGWHDAAEEEKRRRGLPDKLPPHEETGMPPQEQTSSTGAASRAKRSRKS